MASAMNADISAMTMAEEDSTFSADEAHCELSQDSAATETEHSGRSAGVGGAARQSQVPGSDDKALKWASTKGTAVKKQKLLINLCNTNYPVLTNVARELGMGIVRRPRAENCNIVWHDTFPGLEVLMQLKQWQRINHFPGTGEITRKDNLARNVNRMQRLCPADFKFAPRSWILPAERSVSVS